jgi:hypothetical protein
MLEIMTGVVLAIGVAAAIKVWIAVHTHHRDGVRFYRDKFFVHADEVLKDDRTDDSMMARLKHMTQTIDDPRQVASLRRTIAAFEKDMRSGKYKPTGKEPPAEWSRLVFDYLLAVSYLRVIQGVLLRAALTRVLEPSISGENTEVIDQRAHSLWLQPA